MSTFNVARVVRAVAQPDAGRVAVASLNFSQNKTPDLASNGPNTHASTHDPSYAARTRSRCRDDARARRKRRR